MEKQEKLLRTRQDPENDADDLYGRLLRYADGPSCPFHMPGHKRRFHLISDPYSIDITEIEGFDNLHHARGILLQAQERAAALYGSAAAFYLVNGSTAGILTAISAACRRGDRVLAARNCHKSVYHAIWMRGLAVTWLYPVMDTASGMCGSISTEEVERELLAHPGIRAVVLTSPTYDGICSDIRSIAGIVHRYNAVLIVDEAHGAHYGLHPALPESAVTLGADAVIQSMHKTLPALTQTALLHICSQRIRLERVRKFLEVFQTSSPSYVLMASMDRCIRLLEQEGPALYEAYVTELTAARARLGKLKNLHIISGEENKDFCYLYDPTRIVITGRNTAPGCSFGRLLSARLREEWNIEAEMEAEQYVVFLTSVGDTRESFDRLCTALETVDADLSTRVLTSDVGRASAPMRFPVNESVMCMADAEEAPEESIPLLSAEGRISADTVYLYPPGIPLLIPGERIGRELLELLERYEKEGFSLQGMADMEGKRIRVVRPDLL